MEYTVTLIISAIAVIVLSLIAWNSSKYVWRIRWPDDSITTIRAHTQAQAKKIAKRLRAKHGFAGFWLRRM